MIVIVQLCLNFHFKTLNFKFLDSQYYIDSKNISYLYVHVYD